MKMVGSNEAIDTFSALLDEVALGEEFVITKEGIPVAIVKPVAPKTLMTKEEAIEALKRFGKGRPLGGLSIGAMIDEGRRF